MNRDNDVVGSDMNPQAKTLVVYPLIGQTFNQYLIEAFLSQGGMGVVYRARDLKLQRAVALKVLPAELTPDQERRKRFILEARAAARISHPAIAQIYDVDEHEGIFFIAMELVEGKTIDKLIENQLLDLLGAIDISLQVAGGRRAPKKSLTLDSAAADCSLVYAETGSQYRPRSDPARSSLQK